MPWAFEKAGFTQTVFIMVLCGIMCYYTAYLCIKAAEKARGKSEKTAGPGLPEFQVSYSLLSHTWRIIKIRRLSRF